MEEVRGSSPLRPTIILMTMELNTLRHSTSHIMAQAVKRLFPGVKLAIGPAIEDGFYYDFDVPQPFLEEDLPKIEAEMAKIIKDNLKFERSVLKRDEAIKFFENMGEPYKVELIRDLPDAAVKSWVSQSDRSWWMEIFVRTVAGTSLKGLRHRRKAR